MRTNQPPSPQHVLGTDSGGRELIAVMIALGSLSGSRFANTDLRSLASYLVAALGSFSVAVAIPDGLVTPVVRDADQLSISAIASKVASINSTLNELPGGLSSA